MSVMKTSVAVLLLLLPIVSVAHLVEHRHYSKNQQESSNVLHAKDAEIRHFECVRKLRSC